MHLVAQVGEQLQMLVGKKPREMQVALRGLVQLLGCSPQQAVATAIKQPNLLIRRVAGWRCAAHFLSPAVICWCCWSACRGS